MYIKISLRLCYGFWLLPDAHHTVICLCISNAGRDICSEQRNTCSLHVSYIQWPAGTMRKWPSGRCRQNSLSLYIKSLPRNFFPVRQLFSEYRWSSRQVPVWFSGCNKHSTARTPQVIQLPAARFRQNDATDNRVSNSL